VLLALAAVCGCGGGEAPLPRAAVSGTVTLDGQPLQEGVVRFVPIDNTAGPKTSVIVSQGKFSADAEQGPIVGKHRIEIESTDDGGYAMDDEQAIQKLRESGVTRIDVVRVPPNYNSHSTLTETVSADQPNVFQFNLISSQR
jgi:hypothetical protein